MNEKVYLCIDLKSFYASVECVERGLDPLTTNLVVADPERTEKTICLAVSAAMRAQGVPGRCRVFEIPGGMDYIMAPPRMKLYIDYAAEIYGIYLKYIAKEDIYVYSVDEAFMDVTDYLEMYQLSARELALAIMDDILKNTGVTATCGIGTNLYLAKIALDITAKHVDDHIGYLDEALFCKKLWNHRPLTDFWRIGHGISKRLAGVGIFTMGDLAKADEDMLYKMFGIDAELMIDHAWGRETATIRDIKEYAPKNNTLSSAQVLGCPYQYEEGLLVVKEMADLLALELVEKHLAASSVTLWVGYSNEVKKEHAHGTISLTSATNSSRSILIAAAKLYERIVDKNSPIRRVGLSFGGLLDEAYEQYDLFADPVQLERERRLQQATLEIRKKFGKNAILKGMNLEKAGTTMERNLQIGGHKSGETDDRSKRSGKKDMAQTGSEQERRPFFQRSGSGMHEDRGISK